MTSRELPRWTVRSETAVLENPWFRVLRSEVATPSDAARTYWSVDCLRVAVGVVARRPGEVLLVHQHRFLVDRFVWAIPSGGAERDEDLAAAAERELHEETGYHADVVRSLQSYFPSYGMGNQEFHLFEAEVEDGEPDEFDTDEVIEARWFPQAEVKRMALAGEIVDGLSLTPLLLLCAREGW